MDGDKRVTKKLEIKTRLLHTSQLPLTLLTQLMVMQLLQQQVSMRQRMVTRMQSGRLQLQTTLDLTQRC
jgi:hypothetical protein